MEARIEITAINNSTKKVENIKSEFTPGILTNHIKSLIQEVFKYDLQEREIQSIKITM